MAQSTKKITDLTATTATEVEALVNADTTKMQFVTHNGSGARRMPYNQFLSAIPGYSMRNTAGYAAGVHNSIYRGKSLGTTITSAQYDAINAGTFADMYIGDYWTLPFTTPTGTTGTMTVVICAFDYYWLCGDTPSNGLQKHHVTLMPLTNLYTHAMNDADTTAGAYVYSKMRAGSKAITAGTAGALNPDYVANYFETGAGSDAQAADRYTTIPDDAGLYRAIYQIHSALDASGGTPNMTYAGRTGTHLLFHRKYLITTAETVDGTTVTATGVPSAGAWFESCVELPTEQVMYGGCIAGAMTSNNVHHYKYTIDKTQFPLYKFRPDLISNRQYFWLQDVIDNERFANMTGMGSGGYIGNGSHNGVRPVFSIVKS